MCAAPRTHDIVMWHTMAYYGTIYTCAICIVPHCSVTMALLCSPSHTPTTLKAQDKSIFPCGVVRTQLQRQIALGLLCRWFAHTSANVGDLSIHLGNSRDALQRHKINMNPLCHRISLSYHAPLQPNIVQDMWLKMVAGINQKKLDFQNVHPISTICGNGNDFFYGKALKG